MKYFFDCKEFLKKAQHEECDFKEDRKLYKDHLHNLSEEDLYFLTEGIKYNLANNCYDFYYVADLFFTSKMLSKHKVMRTFLFTVLEFKHVFAKEFIFTNNLTKYFYTRNVFDYLRYIDTMVEFDNCFLAFTFKNLHPRVVNFNKAKLNIFTHIKLNPKKYSEYISFE